MGLDLVFVYGTLKQGYGNHHRLLGAKLIGTAVSVEDNFVMQDVGFPILGQAVDYNEAKVVGEIYQTNRAQLAACDRLEDNGRMYIRCKREFTLTEQPGVVVTAWVYLWNLDWIHREVKPVNGMLIWDREGRRRVT